MWEQIITLALGNGLWAALFCALLFYQLNDSRKREHKLQYIIKGLSDSLMNLSHIERGLNDIKEQNLKNIEQDIEVIKDALTKKSERRKPRTA